MYLAVWAPGSVEDGEPRLRAVLEPQEVLDPGTGEVDDCLALEDVWGTRLGRAVAVDTDLGCLTFLVDVTLVEAALLGRGVLPPPPPFPLVLPRQDGPGARLAPNGDVALKHKVQVRVNSSI